MYALRRINGGYNGFLFKFMQLFHKVNVCATISQALLQYCTVWNMPVWTVAPLALQYNVQAVHRCSYTVGVLFIVLINHMQYEKTGYNRTTLECLYYIMCYSWWDMAKWICTTQRVEECIKQNILVHSKTIKPLKYEQVNYTAQTTHPNIYHGHGLWKCRLNIQMNTKHALVTSHLGSLLYSLQGNKVLYLLDTVCLKCFNITAHYKRPSLLVILIKRTSQTKKEWTEGGTDNTARQEGNDELIMRYTH